MRRSKTISLAEALDDYIREMKIEDKLKEISIINSWEETVGRAVASRTKKIYIKDRKLFVSLTSSVVRSELLMLRQELVNRLNEKAGSEIITDIIIR